MPKIAVIGAGIVGASVAYHLARRGAAVTLIDRGRPAGECTGNSFAWIGPADPDTPFSGQPVEDYHRLEGELYPGLPVNWSGVLLWEEEAAETERFAEVRAAAGYDVRLLGRAEIALLEPNLKDPPISAAFAKDAGAIDPVETTKVLVRAAERFGAAVHFDTEPVSLILAGSRLVGVRLGLDVIDADTVVIAAGAGTNALMEPAGLSLPLEDSPALLIRLKTPGVLVNTVIASHARELRQISEHSMISPETALARKPKAAAAQCLLDVRRMLAGAENVEVESMGIGQRPMPADGLPILGFAPGIEGLYLTVMHSGVYYAPMMGRLASVEILDELPVALLDSCRPDRFVRKTTS